MLSSIFKLALVGLLAALLQACASISNGTDMDSVAFRRTAQARSAVELKKEEAQEYARWALPFARVATHVYCTYLSATDLEKQKNLDCKTFPELTKTGWEMLYDWRSVLTESDGRTDLRFMAFGRAEPGRQGEIVIGFKGTDFTSLSDWRSNLRWFTRVLPLPSPDEYQIVHNHAKEMIDLALSKAKQTYPLASGFDVYTTGHSLGGGLAQLLSYSDDRVSGAVAFDSSPVTGYSTLVSNEQINCSSHVLRIYERGEALQYVRSVVRRFHSLSDNINEVSFDLNHSYGNPIANHSMTRFRKGLEDRAGIGQTTPAQVSMLPGKSDCECFKDRYPKDRLPRPSVCLANDNKEAQ